MAEDDKIDIPGDFPGEADDPGDAVISGDPDIIAEKKKNLLTHLKLERYKDIANSWSSILQKFRAEAISLMSGLGTVVMTWFQIRKMVVRGRSEVRALGNAEGRLAGRAAERAERRADRLESSAGTATSGAAKRARAVATAMETPPPPGGELMPPPQAEMSFMLDPMNYLTVGLPIIFIWSSVVAWFKRRHRTTDTQGGK